MCGEAILVMWPGPFEQTFIPPSYEVSIWNWVQRAQWFQRCLKMLTDGWTDDGRRSLWYTSSSPRSLRLRWVKNGCRTRRHFVYCHFDSGELMCWRWDEWCLAAVKKAVIELHVNCSCTQERHQMILCKEHANIKAPSVYLNIPNEHISGEDMVPFKLLVLKQEGVRALDRLPESLHIWCIGMWLMRYNK